MGSKYDYYEIAEVFRDECSTCRFEPDDTERLEDKSLETFFTLYGRFRLGGVLVAEAISDSTSFKRLLKIYGRITGNHNDYDKPDRGHTLELPADPV